MKKGLLLYNDKDCKKNSEYAERFLNNCKTFNLEIELVLVSDIKYGIKNNKFYFSVKEKSITEEEYSFAINKTRNYFIAKILENLGIRVFNNSKITKLCNDKNSTYIEVAKKGIPCLDTFIFNKDNINKNNINYPIIIKQPFGHGGENIYLCNSNKDLDFIISNIKGDYVTIQQYLQSRKINDIRVFIMGNKPLCAVKRTSQKGFKANFCQGGKISLFDIDEKLKEYIDKILEIGYFDFVGFDFLFDDKSYYFNEIEDVVGSRSFCILKNTDTSKIYLEYISKILYNK